MRRAVIGRRRVGYRRVSAVDPNTVHQLEGQFDVEFEDRQFGKDAKQPGLEEMLRQVGEGDTVVCGSMDRMARNLNQLRTIVLGLTKRGIKVEFVKEGLAFTGGDNARSKLLLKLIGAFADFERSLIVERRREGIAIAKAEGRYKGRKAKLNVEQASELRRRAQAGESKTALAKEFGLSRETLYAYLRREARGQGREEKDGK